MNQITKASVRREVRRCRAGLAGFLYWAETYARIEDKETHAELPFKLWPDQRAVIECIFNGEWLDVLKARRLGMTWLFAAFAVWLITFHKQRSALVLNQDDDYARDFLDKSRYILERMPPWMRRTATRDNAKRIEFNREGHGGLIRAFAPTRRALRSLAADFILIDEAAFVPWLRELLRAAEPTLETSKGQLAMVSTSGGPQGEFAAHFKAAWRGTKKARALFFGYQGKPGRDEAWYAAEAAAHADDPLYMKREYPRTWEEAFEAAEGRVFALFSDSPKFIRTLELEKEWVRYRGIDFGGVDPFVCLWAAAIPDEAPGLTIDPSCAHTLEEFLAYAYDEKGYPADEHNHCMDPIRYMTTAFGFTGRVHIYRELYLPNTARKGLDVGDLARRIVELSRNEKIRNTVADRSRPDSINTLWKAGIPCDPSPVLRGKVKTEIEQGIDHVRRLVKAQHDAKEDGSYAQPPRKARRERFALDGSREAALARLYGSGRAVRCRPVCA